MFAILGIIWEWIEAIFEGIVITIQDIFEVRDRYKRDPAKEGLEYYAYLVSHSLYIISKELIYIIGFTALCAILLLFMTLILMAKIAFYTVIIVSGLLFLFAGLS
jgi:hypothetical protein